MTPDGAELPVIPSSRGWMFNDCLLEIPSGTGRTESQNRNCTGIYIRCQRKIRYMGSGHVRPFRSGVASDKRIVRLEGGPGAGNVLLLRMLESIRDTFDCKSVALFSFDGNEFRKMISVPEGAAGEGNPSPWQREHLAMCMASNEDRIPPSDVKIGSEDDLFALPCS